MGPPAVRGGSNHPPVGVGEAIKMTLRAHVRGFARSVLYVGLLTAASAAQAVPFSALTFSPNHARPADIVRLSISVSDGSTPLTNINLAAGAFVYPTGLTNSST